MDPTKLKEMARELGEAQAEAIEIALDPVPSEFPRQLFPTPGTTTHSACSFHLGLRCARGMLVVCCWCAVGVRLVSGVLLPCCNLLSHAQHSHLVCPHLPSTPALPII